MCILLPSTSSSLAHHFPSLSPFLYRCLLFIPSRFSSPRPTCLGCDYLPSCPFCLLQRSINSYPTGRIQYLTPHLLSSSDVTRIISDFILQYIIWETYLIRCSFCTDEPLSGYSQPFCTAHTRLSLSLSLSLCVCVRGLFSHRLLNTKRVQRNKLFFVSL